MPANERLLHRITVTARVAGGRPCIRGSRVLVESVLSRLSEGATPSAIVADHPGLEVEDVLACTAYAQSILERSGPAPGSDHAGDGVRQADGGSAGSRMAAISLRDLASRPPEEIRQVVQARGIVMDAEEITAWDGIAGDGLDE